MPLAITLPHCGGPEVLTAIDLPVADPGPGEVRVRHSVIGVNFVDIYFRMGLYPVPALPAVLGVEAAGTVDAVGDGVTTLRPGDRVGIMGLPMGAYAALRVLPEGRVVRLPDAISDRVAASTLARGLTAHMLLHQVHRLRQGEFVLVHAAAGGLGQIVTRWARRLGAHVIGTVGSAGKAALAEAAGAEVVLRHGDPDWPDQARRIAEGRGVHLAIDGIGGATLARTLEAVRPFGMVASVGQVAGAIPDVSVEALGPRRALALSRPSVLAYANDPVWYREGAAALFAVLADGVAQPVGAEYALRDAARAHADLEAGRTTGSVVLTV